MLTTAQFISHQMRGDTLVKMSSWVKIVVAYKRQLPGGADVN